MAGEFFTKTADPKYQEIAEKATITCQQVDPRYTDKFLAQAEEAKKLTQM